MFGVKKLGAKLSDAFDERSRYYLSKAEPSATVGEAARRNHLLMGVILDEIATILLEVTRGEE